MLESVHTCLNLVGYFFISEKEQYRQDFASQANHAGAYIDAKNIALSELNMQGQGTLEEQLQLIKGFQEEVAGYQPIIEQCEAANQAAQASMVFENPHTNYTMDVSSMRVYCQQLLLVIIIYRLCVHHGGN